MMALLFQFNISDDIVISSYIDVFHLFFFDKCINFFMYFSLIGSSANVNGGYQVWGGIKSYQM